MTMRSSLFLFMGAAAILATVLIVLMGQNDYDHLLDRLAKQRDMRLPASMAPSYILTPHTAGFALMGVSLPGTHLQIIHN